jgi:hypothetical protein
MKNLHLFCTLEACFLLSLEFYFYCLFYGDCTWRYDIIINRPVHEPPITLFACHIIFGESLCPLLQSSLFLNI